MIYLVYKVNHNKKGGSSIYPFLYAYTDSKKLIKKFQKERNMDEFHIIEKDLSDDEIEIFIVKNSHQRLLDRKYDTYIKTESSYIKDYVEIVSTEYEEEQTYVSMDKAVLEAGKFTNVHIAYTFNKDIIKALKTLEYFSISEFKYFDGNSCIYPSIQVNKYVSKIKVDMFYVFMFLFGNTMKK